MALTLMLGFLLGQLPVLPALRTLRPWMRHTSPLTKSVTWGHVAWPMFHLALVSCASALEERVQVGECLPNSRTKSLHCHLVLQVYSVPLRDAGPLEGTATQQPLESFLSTFRDRETSLHFVHNEVLKMLDL